METKQTKHQARTMLIQRSKNHMPIAPKTHGCNITHSACLIKILY